MRERIGCDRKIGKGDLIVRVGRENEVVLLGAISSEFCAMCTSVGMGL